MEAENGYEEGAKKYFYAGDTSSSGNTTYTERFLDISTLVGTNKIQNTEWEVFTEMTNQSHREHLAVEEGDLIWFAEDSSNPEVDWCLQLGLKVFVIGKGYITESGNYQTGSSGGYGNTVGDSSEAVPSGVWCNAPDLSSGWNTGATYYVSYSSLDSDARPGDLIYKDAPSGWYDYGAGKWANIATVSKGALSYWTWIPRYMVKMNNLTGEIEPLEGTSGADAKSDVKFVDINNTWQGSDGSTMTATELAGAGYMLPDAFTFNGKTLSGIWVAKYEVSNPSGIIGFGVKSGENSITITSLTYDGNNFSSEPDEDIRLSKLDILVNGSIYSYTEDGETVIGSDVVLGSEGFTIKGLRADTEYTITVIIKSKYMKELNLESTKKVKTTKGGLKSNPDITKNETDIVAPDLSGFNASNTFYATINNSGQIVKGSSISEEPPEDWYDYGNQRWANIMTLNTDVNQETGKVGEHNGEMAIWVWIPRYEYKIDYEKQTVDTVFLPLGASVDSGYQVPDAFKFRDKDLAGIWVAKYEVSNPQLPDGLNLQAVGGGFKIKNVIYAGDIGNVESTSVSNNVTASASDATTGTIVATPKNGGTARTISFTVGDTITSLPEGLYTLSVTMNRAYKNVGGTDHPITFTQEVYVKGTVAANAPDLSGFKDSTAYIYYVMYTSGSSVGTVGKRVVFSGNDYGYCTTDDDMTTFVSGGPSGWYDYDSNLYANIIVSSKALASGTVCQKKVNNVGLPEDAESKITMWVWIPRYQFGISKTVNTIWVSGTDGESAGSGYGIPDAFNFGGAARKGIWISKYEINRDDNTSATPAEEHITTENSHPLAKKQEGT